EQVPPGRQRSDDGFEFTSPTHHARREAIEQGGIKAAGTFLPGPSGPRRIRSRTGSVGTRGLRTQ
ncbi:MAG: hypothetical protein KDB13_15640, partial [Microthrixaceae bacterium]|nr:hypothetical protein [Microthrixaceae bacterium]